MRNALCDALCARAADPQFVFLTGDLGFQALEPLRDAMGDRFINAGIAEQNMVSVAAGLARAGMKPWVYSIAPFLYARPYEQIRNDVCFHRLPVRLVGNGGGYGYGPMGATHHALEDYGALLPLPGMQVLVPAFAEDVAAAVEALFSGERPAYLRLGRSELPAGYVLPQQAAWRRLVEGGGPTVAVVGPLAGGLLAACLALPWEQRPRFWVVSHLPLSDLPELFLQDIRHTDRLIVFEEHVARGGFGEELAYALMRRGVAPPRFEHRFALGYPSGTYGSQQFHRRECGLDDEALLALLRGTG